MEEWEAHRVNSNLKDLIRLTSCSPGLLAGLMEHEVLADVDIDQLTTKGFSEFEKTFQLYSILKKKTGAYNALTDVLLSERQTGAYQILKQGVVDNGGVSTNKPESLFSTPLPAIATFIDNQTTNMLVISTEDRHLSMKRVADTGVAYLKTHDLVRGPITPKLGELTDGMALVINCDDKIETVLPNIPHLSKKIVLVTTESVEEIERVTKLHTPPKPLIYSEKIDWADLRQSTQNKILGKSITFQNQVTQLANLPGIKTDQINGTLLVQLMNDMCPEFVNNSVPPLPSYYIPREIFSSRRISLEIFESPGRNVFIIKGIELHQLTNLVRGRDIDKSSNQKEELTVQFIQLVGDKDFDEICKLAKHPCHLLSYDGSHLAWLRSHGSLELIQKHIDHDHQELTDEATFMSKCLSSGSPVCIGDTPGMGKSVLLAKIADTLMSQNPSAVVRFVVFREVLREVGSQPITMESVCHLIAHSASEYDLGRQFVENALKSETVKCHLLFDGYDEVLKDQVHTANEIIQLSLSLKNTQVYVTTRPHVRHKLENVLGTLGFNMTPFQTHHQVDFLTGYWAAEGATKSDRLIQFAKTCLTSLKSNMTDFERDICGIPLQCKMLGQVNLHLAQQHSGSSDSQMEPVSLKSSSIFGMYQQLMDSGFEKLSSIQLKPSWMDWMASFLSGKKDLKEVLLHVHMYYAIELLYPDLKSGFGNLLGKASSEQLAFLFVPGILELGVHHEYPRFVHRTYAEYLVALYVLEFLDQKQTESSGSALLDVVLSTHEVSESLLTFWKSGQITGRKFEYPIVCYFFNFTVKTVIKEDNSKLEKFRGVISKQAFESEYFVNIYTASVVSDYPAIALLLVALLTQNSNLVPWSTLLLLAGKHAGKELISQLKRLLGETTFQSISDLEYPSTLGSCEADFTITPLHVAVERGEYTVSTFIFNHGGFKDLLMESSSKTQFLIHVCVCKSYRNESIVIQDKIQIIKLLSTTNNSILQEKMERTCPVLQPYAHLDLLKCLIELGADTNQTNRHNVLQSVIENRNDVSPAQYHEHVVALTKSTFTLFDKPDVFDQPPLFFAMRWIDLELRTVDIFLERGANVNSMDGVGNSVLHAAIMRGRSKTFIQELVSRGANLEHISYPKESALHIAAKYGNFGVVEYLLEAAPSLLNLTDENGENALHLAMLNNTPNFIKIQVELIAAGVDIVALNKKRVTPFLHGLKYGKGLSLKVIKLVEDKFAPIFHMFRHLCLRSLLTNQNLSEWEWNDELIAVANFLGEKTTIGSYDSKMIALLNSHQFKQWLAFRDQVVSVEKKTPRFTTPPPEFISFLRDPTKSLLIIFTNHKLTTERRVRDYFCIPKGGLMNAVDGVQFMGDTTPLEKVVNLLPPLKIVLVREGRKSDVPESAKDKHNVQLTVDEYTNCDLSPTLRDNVLRTTSEKFHATGILNSLQEVVEFYSQAKTRSKLPFQNIILSQLKIKQTLPFSISLRTGLSKNIFDHFLEDRLVFHGISMEELKLFDQVGHTLRTSTDEERVSDYVVVDDKKEFERISEKWHVPVHLVEYNKPTDSFQLKDSYSSIGEICKFLEPRKNVSQRSLFSEESVIKLVAAPTFYYHTQLAKLIKNLVATSVVLMELKTVSSVVSNFAEEEEQKSGEDMAVNILAELLDEDVQAGQKFDIILPLEPGWRRGDVEKLLELEELVDDSKMITLWLLTPENSIMDVERIIGTVGYQLGRIKREHLVKFMVDLWKGNGNDEEERLEEIANSCLDKYEVQLQSKSSVYCGKIQSRLEFRTFSPAENPVFYSFLLAKCFKPEDTPGGVVLELDLMQMVQTFCSKVKDESMLMQTVIKSSFPEWTKYFHEAIDVTETKIIRDFVGIEAIHDWYVPVMEELSSYFMAAMLVNLKSDLCREGKVPLLKFVFSVEEIEPDVFLFTHPSLLYFANSLSTSDNDSFLEWIRNTTFEEEKMHLYGILVACVIQNHLNLLKIFIPGLKNDEDINKLVKVAITYADKEMVQHVCDFCDNAIGSSSSLLGLRIYYEGRQCSLLEMAVHRGDLSITEYLIDSQQFLNFEECLHWCVWKSGSDLEKVVYQKKRIIDMLIKREPQLVTKGNSNGIPPLLTESPHVELIKHLISVGADPTATTQSKENILHLATRFMSPSEYHNLVDFLAQTDPSSEECFKMRSAIGWSVLYQAVVYIEANPETLRIFHQVGLDFNTKPEGEESMTLLKCAILKDRSATLIKTLIECGADWQEKDKDGYSLLHYAAQVGSLSAMRALISRGISVNDKNNEYQHSPLHHAVCKADSIKLISTMDYLIRQGADVSAMSRSGYSLLYSAAKERTKETYFEIFHLLETVAPQGLLKLPDEHSTPLHSAVYYMSLDEDNLQLMLNYYDINALDGDGDCVLTSAIQGGRDAGFLDMLIRHGANPRSRNAEGFTMLHWAARDGNVSALKYFLGRGEENVNETSANQSTPLHYAFWSRKGNIHEMVTILLEAGAKPDVKDETGVTPLEIAERGERMKKVESRTVQIIRDSLLRGGLL